MTTSPSYLISHNTTNSDCCSGDRCPGGPVSLRPRVWRHNLILIYRTPPLCSTLARPLFAYERDKEDLSSTVSLSSTLSRFWAEAIYPAWWLIVYCTPLLPLLLCTTLDTVNTWVIWLGHWRSWCSCWYLLAYPESIYFGWVLVGFTLLLNTVLKRIFFLNESESRILFVIQKFSNPNPNLIQKIFESESEYSRFG